MFSLWKTKLAAGIQTLAAGIQTLAAGIQTKVGLAVLAVLLVGGAGTALAVIAAHGTPSASPPTPSNTHCGQKDHHDADEKDQHTPDAGDRDDQGGQQSGQNHQQNRNTTDQCDQRHQGESHLVGPVARVDRGTASFVLLLV